MFSSLLSSTPALSALEETHAQMMEFITAGDATAFEKGLRSLKPASLDHAGGAEKLTLLQVAALHDNVECARLLLTATADPNAIDPAGFASLSSAEKARRTSRASRRPFGMEQLTWAANTTFLKSPSRS